MALVRKLHLGQLYRMMGNGRSYRISSYMNIIHCPMKLYQKIELVYEMCTKGIQENFSESRAIEEIHVI